MGTGHVNAYQKVTCLDGLLNHFDISSFTSKLKLAIIYLVVAESRRLRLKQNAAYL
jgi:hypothetical protein